MARAERAACRSVDESLRGRGEEQIVPHPAGGRFDAKLVGDPADIVMGGPHPGSKEGRPFGTALLRDSRLG